jgi:hypothetical protein
MCEEMVHIHVNERTEPCCCGASIPVAKPTEGRAAITGVAGPEPCANRANKSTSRRRIRTW